MVGGSNPPAATIRTVLSIRCGSKALAVGKAGSVSIEVGKLLAVLIVSGA